MGAFGFPCDYSHVTIVPSYPRICTAMVGVPHRRLLVELELDPEERVQQVRLLRRGLGFRVGFKCVGYTIQSLGFMVGSWRSCREEGSDVERTWHI